MIHTVGRDRDKDLGENKSGDRMVKMYVYGQGEKKGVGGERPSS